MPNMVPCSVCGDLRSVSKGSKPAGELVCHACRRDRRLMVETARPPRPVRSTGERETCADCGATRSRGGSGGYLPQGGYRCQQCRRIDAKSHDREYNRQRCAEYYQRKRAAKRNRDHIGRARKYGVPFETIDDAAVFERDSWRCGICGEPVNPKLAAPHILAVSLDHLQPLSRGGGHVYANVQCAHWICNSIKSDRSDSVELALLG